MWSDAHNHLQDPRLGDAPPVIEAMRAAGVERCVVNTTSEEDWAVLETLADCSPDFVLPAFGIHPWRAHTANEGWQDRLKALLEKHPLASIGEIGLDRWISTPSEEVQLPVFLDQLRIARELKRPVTIHCLKAWGPLFDAFKKVPPPGKFLMHSFNGSLETAKRLIPLGAYFSFSGYFLNERKSGVVDVFRKLPLDRILLETDAPDMLPPAPHITHPLAENHNHPANLPAIGRALASLLGMDPEELAKVTRENAKRCFETGRDRPPCGP